MRNFLLHLTLLMALSHTPAFGLESKASISGTVKGFEENVWVRLSGFDGIKPVILDSVRLSEGSFRFAMPKKYRGLATIIVENMGSVFCVIDGKPIAFEADGTRKDPEKFAESISILKGGETKFLRSYYIKKQYLEEKINALSFQKETYEKEDKFYKTILQGEARLEKDLRDFYKTVDPKKYPMSVYLIGLNDIIMNIEMKISKGVKMTKADEKEVTLTFKKIDFSDTRLYHTGILDRLLYRYITSAQALYAKDKASFQRETKYKIRDIFKSVDVKSKFGKQIFEFFLSGFEAMGYNIFIDALLTQIDRVEECDLSAAMIDRVKSYKRVAKGAKAPEIVFEEKIKGRYSELSQIVKNHKFTVLVFWASWCSHCKKEIPEFHKMYSDMTSKDIGVLAISADTDPEEYQSMIEGFDWLNYCDFKKWNSKPFKDYAVYATPTFYVIDRNMKIYGKYANSFEVKTALSL